MIDLSTAILRVLVAHREQYPLVTGGLAPCVTCHTPYPCVVAEALEPVRRILALPACQDCGMRHGADDMAACIEGHGDDPVHGVNCPIAQTSDPMSCTCDDEPVPYRGQIGTGF